MATPMSDAAFDKVIPLTLQFEGGYVNDPDDPGGETNFGISKRSYPDVDIANLTREGAIAIYKRDFWDRPELGTLPDPIGAKLFDLSVNMGLQGAVKVLQRALGTVVEDGVLGPKTRAVCGAKDPYAVVDDMCTTAEDHYRGIVALRPRSAKFLKGWLRRACAVPIPPPQEAA